MPYIDTITITNNSDEKKFTLLLLVLLISIMVYCILNILCDHLRMKKIELAIYLIEKGHSAKMADKNEKERPRLKKVQQGDNVNGKYTDKKKRNYYSSV